MGQNLLPRERQPCGCTKLCKSSSIVAGKIIAISAAQEDPSLWNI